LIDTRKPTPAEFQVVQDALDAYATIYGNKKLSPADDFITGTKQSIEDAGWLYYEGTDGWFPSGLLDSTLPWLVMKALVANDDCTWIIHNGSVALQHPLLARPITHASLTDMTWVQSEEYDETPQPGEVALDSFSHLMSAFAKKRIHGVKPLR
jgi:hypothetical protein